MNRHILFITALMLFLFTACGGSQDNHQSVGIDTAEEVKAEVENTPDSFDASFADGMTGRIFQDYLRLQTALVESDDNTAKDAAQDMMEAFGTDRPELRQAASTIAQASDLEARRAAFSEFTEAAGDFFEQGLSRGSIYLVHCPMAFDNEGANWYSDKEEVLNPYFGDRMLRCGKVAETITK